MGIKTQNKNPHLLEIVSVISPPDHRNIIIADNESGTLSLKVETRGYGNDKTGKTIVDLWNGYQSLPLHLKLSPAMVFQMLIEADKEDAVDLKDENISLRWWNNVYRWGYFVVIMALIFYPLYKHYL